jgi:hypothetical protein
MNKKFGLAIHDIVLVNSSANKEFQHYELYTHQITVHCKTKRMPNSRGSPLIPCNGASLPRWGLALVGALAFQRPHPLYHAGQITPFVYVDTLVCKRC